MCPRGAGSCAISSSGRSKSKSATRTRMDSSSEVESGGDRGQNGNPLPSRRPNRRADAPPTLAGPVDIRNVSLSVLTALGGDPDAAVHAAGPDSGGARDPHQLCAVADRHDAGATRRSRARSARPSRLPCSSATIGFAFYTFSDEAMGIIRDIPPAARTLRERLEAQRTKASETALRAGPGSRDRDRQGGSQGRPNRPSQTRACRRSRSCSRRSGFRTTSGWAAASCRLAGSSW